MRKYNNRLCLLSIHNFDDIGNHALHPVRFRVGWFVRSPVSEQVGYNEPVPESPKELAHVAPFERCRRETMKAKDRWLAVLRRRIEVVVGQSPRCRQTLVGTRVH